MKTKKRLLLKITAFIFCIYLLAGFVLLPYIVKDKIVQFTEDSTSFTLNIGNIDFNPLDFSILIESVALSKQNTPVITLGHAHVDLNVIKSLTGTVSIEPILINQLNITLEQTDDGLTLLQDFASSSDTEPGQTADTTAASSNLKWYLAGLQINDTTFTWLDRTFKQTMEVPISDIDLAIGAVDSSLAEDIPYSLSFAILDSQTAFSGAFNANDIRGDGTISIDRLPLKLVNSVVNEASRVSIADGHINLEAKWKHTPESSSLTADFNIEELDLISTRELGTPPNNILQLGSLNLQDTELSYSTDASLQSDEAFSALATISTQTTLNDLTLFSPPEENSDSSKLAELGTLKLNGLIINHSMKSNKDNHTTLSVDTTLEQFTLFSMPDKTTDANIPPGRLIELAALNLDDLNLVHALEKSRTETSLSLAELQILSPYVSAILESDGQLNLEKLSNLSSYAQLFNKSEDSQLEPESPGSIRSEPAIDKSSNAVSSTALSSTKLSSTELSSATASSTKGSGAADSDMADLNPTETITTDTKNTVADDSESIASDKAFKIALNRLALKDGTIEFHDKSLANTKTQYLHDINVELDQINWPLTKPTDAKAHLRLNEEADIELKALLASLSPKINMEMNLATKNISLTDVTAYAEAAIGYGITKGILNTDHQYIITDDELKAGNHLLVDKIKLESHTPKITLPLKLAISLLKDSDGLIDVKMPISGTVTSPDFHIGKLIREGLVAMIQNTVTKPFSALGGVLGVKDDISKVSFEPNASSLLSSQDRRVRLLAKALNKRPELRIEIIGRSSAILDTADANKKAPTATTTEQAGSSPEASPGETSGTANKDQLIELAHIRAQVVWNILLKEGISQDRMTTTTEIVDISPKEKTSGKNKAKDKTTASTSQPVKRAKTTDTLFKITL